MKNIEARIKKLEQSISTDQESIHLDELRFIDFTIVNTFLEGKIGPERLRKNARNILMVTNKDPEAIGKLFHDFMNYHKRKREMGCIAQ